MTNIPAQIINDPIIPVTANETIVYATGVIITFVILFALLLSLDLVIKKIARRTSNELLAILRKDLRGPLVLLAIVLALWIPLSVATVPEVLLAASNKVLSILLITVLAWISIRFVKLVKYLVLQQYDIDRKDNLEARKVYTQFRIIERILVFLILLIAISLALMTFDGIRKIGISLIASAGVAGLILGLAAQKVIGGILAGIQIALTQPIRLDDVVVVENEWGRIEEIALTYVVVRIWDQRRLVLPTAYFIEQPFQNWTRTSAEIHGTVFIYADYTVPFDELRKELTRLLQGCPYWDGRVNVLQVTNATEKTVEIRALVSAADSSSAWDLRVYIRERLIMFLQEKYPECLPRARVILPDRGTGE